MKVFHGRVHDGVVVFEEGPVLPEGAAVTVSCAEAEISKDSVKHERIKFPLVHSKHPGSLNLTNEQIAEILNEEDVSPRR
ncbi:MAG TPA: hypothetical protein VGP68_00830 [Gemmataceae bacterium]|jgi:hypothetical protein|nr:hypothetical protein [Gemmataceae bacterium]